MVERFGQRHLIECNCILPQYKNRKDPLFHKFTVFSIVEDNDVIPKVVQCPNCGIVHRITEIGVSEMIPIENTSSVRTIEDIKFSLADDVVALLESNHCDLSIWEAAEFIVENERWGDYVILNSEHTEEGSFGKIMIFRSPGYVKVEPFSRTDAL